MYRYLLQKLEKREAYQAADLILNGLLSPRLRPILFDRLCYVDVTTNKDVQSQRVEGHLQSACWRRWMNARFWSVNQEGRQT